MRRDDIPLSTFEKITDVLLNTARVHPRNLFLRIRLEERVVAYTYQDTVDRVSRIGHYLTRKGFVPGQRAAVVGDGCPEWMFAYLGILWAGGVVVPLDCRARASELAHPIRHSECRFIFCSSRFQEAFEEMSDDVPSLEQIIVFSGMSSIFVSYEGLHDPEPRTRDDMAVILYTSGTTGSPKGVILTHGNLLANLEQVFLVLEIHEGDRFLSVLPIHHSFETTCGFLLPLVEGAAITFATSLKSKELLDDLKETRPTVFLVVPLLLEKLHQGLMKRLQKGTPVRKGIFYGLRTLARVGNPLLKGEVSKRLFLPVRAAMGLNELRYLVSGGAPLSRKLSKEYELLGFPILQGYGLTETAPVLSVNLPNRCRNQSTGCPLPGISVKILEPSREGIGEIAVRGPNVMKGYYRNPEATEDALRQGWLHTGDLGRIDEAGFLHVTGRKKSLIVTRGGKNISPEEIEEELLKSPFIKETLVLARLHQRTKNEEVHAIVYPDFDRLDEQRDRINARNLIQAHIKVVNSGLAVYKQIRSFSIREEEFPKTTTQKIKRYLFEEGGFEVKSSPP